MPKFQKVSLQGPKITFTVFCDDGHAETQTYLLEEGEQENDLMTRVALHINSERMVKVEELPTLEVEAEPVMEVSVSKEGKLTVKEVSEEKESTPKDKSEEVILEEEKIEDEGIEEAKEV